MLVVGTTGHLEDLDRSYTYAEDVSVTALAVGSLTGAAGSLLPTAAGQVWSVLDRERIVALEQFDVTPLARLVTATAQSLAVSPGGSLVVGLAGAHLLSVSADGEVHELGSFDAVAGRDEWHNPAGPLPDLRSVAVSGADVWFAGVHVGGLWRSRDRGGSCRASSRPRRTFTRLSRERPSESRSPLRSASGGAKTAVTAGSGRRTGCTPAIRERWHSTATQPSSPLRPVPTPRTAAFTDAASGKPSSRARVVFRHPSPSISTPGPSRPAPGGSPSARPTASSSGPATTGRPGVLPPTGCAT